MINKLRIVACNSHVLMLNNTLAVTGLMAPSTDELQDQDDDDT